jgi:hypothetical protein
VLPIFGDSAGDLARWLRNDDKVRTRICGHAAEHFARESMRSYTVAKRSSMARARLALRYGSASAELWANQPVEVRF